MFRSVLLFLFLFPWPLLAQPLGCELVLSGRVSDEHDRSGLGFAEVRILELARSVQADEQGVYRIEGLCEGSYTLQVAHLGCDPVIVKIQLSRSTEKDLFLEHHESELKDLEVIRKRPDENVGLSRTELDKVALESSAGRTLAEALSSIPGVNMLSSGPTINKPVIHGLYGNRILTLNQGIRQEDQQWGTEHAPNLDPFSSVASPC
ncbi:MAG: carboxypeptidase-like regulatory domain-containing protein [Flavobacteriales bacterium]|nr:carboxypeptidase-like regulatory domain-containing protein [Flavobacteriales bacterium]